MSLASLGGTAPMAATSRSHCSPSHAPGTRSQFHTRLRVSKRKQHCAILRNKGTDEVSAPRKAARRLSVSCSAGAHFAFQVHANNGFGSTRGGPLLTPEHMNVTIYLLLPKNILACYLESTIRWQVETILPNAKPSRTLDLNTRPICVSCNLC